MKKLYRFKMFEKKDDYPDIGTIVKSGKEWGVVVKTPDNIEWLDEPICVRWDTKDVQDYEQYWPPFYDNMTETDQNHIFKYINKDGTKK